MDTARPNRRQILRGLAGASALAAFPAATMAQDAGTLSLPQDSEVLSAYDVQQVNGYTKITMDHVRPNADGSGVLDVEAIRMDLDMEARRNGTPTPIIITDYAYDGPEEMYSSTAKRTQEQDDLFEPLLPALAKRSQRPIVHLRVSAYGEGSNNDLTTLHAGALISDLETNKLGPGETTAEVPGGIALPYLNVNLDGQTLYDAAFDWFGDTPTATIQRSLAGNIIHVIDQQNEVLTNELEP